MTKDIKTAFSITTDGTHFYVGGLDQTDTSRIWRIPVGGGAATGLYQGSDCPKRPCFAQDLAVIGNDLFWIDPNSGPSTDTQILKGSTDGTATVTAIYTGSSVGQPIVDGVGLTTNGTKLFSADAVQGRIHSLEPDGSSLTLLGSRFPGFFDTERFHNIFHDSGTLFIVDMGCDDRGRGCVASSAVVSHPAGAGSFTNLHVGAPLGGATGVAVLGGTIFVVDGGLKDTIWTLPTTGGTPTVFISGSPFVSLFAITAFNNALYVTDRPTGKIFKISTAPVFTCVAGGFEPPFDTLLALKKKTKKVIPVKMVLEDDAMAVITDLDVMEPPVVNVVFSPVAGGGDVSVTGDLLPVGEANVDNIFRFDDVMQEWIYNLGSKPFTAPGTYTVTAVAGDASYEIDSSCTGTFERLE